MSFGSDQFHELPRNERIDALLRIGFVGIESVCATNIRYDILYCGYSSTKIAVTDNQILFEHWQLMLVRDYGVSHNVADCNGYSESQAFFIANALQRTFPLQDRTNRCMSRALYVCYKGLQIDDCANIRDLSSLERAVLILLRRVVRERCTAVQLQSAANGAQFARRQFSAMDIIIVAPHSRCIIGASVRTCDLRAGDAAQLIYAYLSERLAKDIFNILLTLSDTIRQELDMNRAVARNSAWRKEIQRRVAQSVAAGRYALVLDIHSFPDDVVQFGLDERSDKSPAVVLLDFYGVHNLQELPAIVKPLQATRVNDIITTALDSGADAFLWEFNENRARFSDSIVIEVAEYMHQYVTMLIPPTSTKQ